MTTTPRRLRTVLSAAALLLVAGCETCDPGNPLIGRWTLRRLR